VGQILFCSFTICFRELGVIVDNNIYLLMPICKKCNSQFPNSILENGVRKWIHSRSYCLSCSPRGENAGYDLRKRSTDEKYKEIYKSQDSVVCKVCERHYPRKRKNNLVCSTCRSNYQRYKNKQKAINLLGSKCSKCSSTDCDTFTFHHINPDEKKLALANSWGNVNWNLLESEIKKCILLCYNCHMKEHKKDLAKLIEFYEKSS